jgi:phosphate transport system protein
MNQTHTVKSYDADLTQLRSLISQMGGIAETQIRGAIDALAKRNIDAAGRIVEADKKLDLLESEVEQLAVRTIALRAPMADDLRQIVSALKLSSMLERIGDYAKNIAKRTAIIAQSPPVQPQVIVYEMARVAGAMLSNVLDAYARSDTELAVKVRDADTELDALYNSLFRSLLTYMMENPQAITPSTHVLFIAKNLERIGDHATNMAENVYYNVTGTFLDSERPKGPDPSQAIPDMG